MKTANEQYQRLQFTLGAVSDLSQHAVEAREFASAAHSILYLLLGAVGVSRGVLFGSDAVGSLFSAAVKGLRWPAFRDSEAGRLRAGSRAETLELARCPQLLPAADKRLPSALRLLFSQAGLTLALPLVVRGRLAGLLALGTRLNGEPLSAHERGVLETLGPYAAMLLHQHDLMEQLRAAVHENLRLCETLADTYFDTVQAFSAAIDAKDIYTRGHSMRVARYSAALAARLGMPQKAVTGVRIGAYLHDIGKIVLDRALLNKPGRLNDQERREMWAHPTVGDEVLSAVSFPWPEVRAVVRSHHERLDGRGYPDGLKGPYIPLPARVLSVADSFDAMTTDRPYRQRMTVGSALIKLVECSGVQFDPPLVRLFLEQCRSEIEPEGGDGDGRAGKRSGLRVFGRLLGRAGASLTTAMIDQLMASLGPSAPLLPA